MREQITETLITREQIARRTAELGAEISNDYRGKNLLLAGVLKGSLVFMADLMRNITIDCKIDFIAISSYGGGTETTGRVRLIKDFDIELKGHDVLVVEDILDTGFTLSYVSSLIELRKPASIKVCTLLDKPQRRCVPLQADYRGFEIPDKFVVGYGLDYGEKYRNLPYVGVLD